MNKTGYFCFFSASLDNISQQSTSLHNYQNYSHNIYIRFFFLLYPLNNLNTVFSYIKQLAENQAEKTVLILRLWLFDLLWCQNSGMLVSEGRTSQRTFFFKSISVNSNRTGLLLLLSVSHLPSEVQERTSTFVYYSHCEDVWL